MSFLLPKVGDKSSISLGIMGGTFDPIHLGHLVTAEEARQQFNLDYVVFVPSGQPPHKKGLKITDSEHRYLMTMLAVITNPYFTVSRVEIDRDGYSYTIDTVRKFQEFYDNRADIFFITGADAILDILTWKNYDKLVSTCKFIAATRPGYSLEKLKETVGSVCPEIISRVYILEIPAMSISSTFIRQRVAEGKTIKYLTPEPVMQYIYKNKLYVNDG